jgi:capsular polysaccharide transport system permease protein
MENDEDRRVEATVIEATPLAPPVPESPTLAATSLRLARRVFGLRVSPPTQVENDEALQLLPAPRNRPSAYLISLFGLVVVPSIIAALYLAFIASDQYVAEARFAVKSAQFDNNRQKKPDVSGMASEMGVPSSTNQESYIIANYIHSRAIVDDLSKTVNLDALFRRPEADFWARLKQGASAEELVDYWKGMVRTYVDGPSGIVTIEARAFRPEDALALTRAILEASEKLANDVSARMRNDTMKMAEEEVRKTEGSVEAALTDMRKFRDEKGYIDPIASATSTSELLLQLMGEKIRLQNDYFVATRAMSPEAPTVATLKTRLETLDGQISDLKSKLAGNSKEGETISAALVKFESLELQRQFAEKMYELAQDSLERARIKAERQNVYVEVFVPPALPEDAKYPERALLGLLIPGGLLIVWGILALTAAAIEDHRY